MNPPKFTKTEDMANLTFLNEASVLNNLKERYSAMMIYTYSGLFCVVINPYKRLPIYTESVIKAYIGKRRSEMPPHLFAVSDEAYRNMVQDKENQSMLITGESGAGKTENTKKVISYFAIVGATQQAAEKKQEGAKKGGTLEEQIVQTNPVLEAFGNAKTVRNNNSSRFGKFIRTHFSNSGKLAGGDIEHYLLEKSRVVRQAPGERCYHIFYQIMSGNDPQLRSKLKLTNELKYYHFCSQAELTIEGVDDKEEMRLTQEAFDIMGFEDEETANLYSNCAGIMHMGEMKFKQRPREEQAEVDTEDDAKNAAHCFGIDHEAFLKALTKPRVRVGNEWVNKGQNLEQVSWAVSGLGKAIYARQFRWLINRCNKTLDAKAIERARWIGVLDIAGFEIFDLNSFEQLWINFVNERLQQFFNHHMFILEQEEYKREGIAWTFIDFGLDLQACIELIEKPLGIISMLDEECIVPKASDMTFVQKLTDQHLGKHPNFQKPKPPKGKQAEAHFAVVHYAGTVRYNANNFLEKNKDPLNDSAVAVLKTASNALTREIFDDYVTQEEAAELAKAGTVTKKKGKSSSFMTVSMMYRESLNNLMTMLYQTHPHFIRCIIPNEKKQSGLIDSALVLNQLTCNGVLEGIRICRKGFPNRQLYADFKHRYSILAADAARNPDEKAASKGITDQLCNEGNLNDEEFKLGNTKVFFKAGVLARLEDLRDEKLGAIMTMFQQRIRWYLAQADVKRRIQQRAGLLILQRNIRQWCTLRTWPWFVLYGRVRPMLKTGKEKEEIEALEKKIAENEEKASKLQAQKADLDRQVDDLSGRLEDMEDRSADLQRSKKKLEGDVEAARKQAQDLELSLRKAESEKQAREHNIRSLQDELANADEALAKANKAAKQQEEANRKLLDDLQGEEEKVNHTNKLKQKLEQALDDAEDNAEREKRQRQELEKSKRKAEGEIKVQQENIDELNRQLADIRGNLQKKETELHSVSSRLEDEQSLVGKLQRQLKELQSRIAELEDELENERQSRQKADRSKGELQRELEELSERLDEQGGATAAQIEIAKKREAELSKLRRSLEEQHINHETALGSLRKKHNDAVAELSDQVEQLQKAKIEEEQEAKAEALRQVSKANAEIQQWKARFEGEGLVRLEEVEEAKRRLQQKVQDLTDANEAANVKIASLEKTRHKLMGDLGGDRGTPPREQVEEEQRLRDDIRDQYLNAEKRNQILSAEKEELARQAEAAERARRAAEADLIELREAVNDLSAQVNSLGGLKRKLEGELQALHAELDEALSELKSADELAKKASADAARLAEELRQEQEHSQHVDRLRKGLEIQIKEMQVRLDEAEAAALKGGKRIIAQLEQRIRALEQELDGEQRRHQETDKNFRKADRRVKELDFQVEEDRKNSQQLTDLIDKLQGKLKVLKRQQEEAEEVAATNLGKYRQVLAQLEEAEEARDIAENSISKLRAKTRASASIAPASGLATSASAAVLRSSSRNFDF
ncbi:Myosin-3 [Aphelenchoides fujianensis]|nr:Myosin-3 [Aphelenchoides fujianensis]